MTETIYKAMTTPQLRSILKAVEQELELRRLDPARGMEATIAAIQREHGDGR